MDLGDHDLLITFLTLKRGKISVIAKNAKKSRKRFPGHLELFSHLNLVCRRSLKGGLSILQEASMISAFCDIRGDVEKTAYASYWADLVNGWLEEWKPQEPVYHLLGYALDALDKNLYTAAEMSIIFQIRLLSLSGFAPNLKSCTVCRKELDEMENNGFIFDLAKGGIVCKGCSSGESRTRLPISKGTAKQLMWIRENDIRTVQRLRFTPAFISEAQTALERFVPYHLGREPKSLMFLKQLRSI